MSINMLRSIWIAEQDAEFLVKLDPGSRLSVTCYQNLSDGREIREWLTIIDTDHESPELTNCEARGLVVRDDLGRPWIAYLPVPGNTFSRQCWPVREHGRWCFMEARETTKVSYSSATTPS